MSVSSQSQRQSGESPSELPDSDVTDESNATTVIPPATDDESHDSLELHETTGVGQSEIVETDIADDGNLQRDVTRNPVAASVPVNKEPSVELRSDEEEQRPQETQSPPVPNGELERTASVYQVKLPDGSRALFAPRRSVLLSFAGMFALMIGSLELLNYLSHRYTGIATVEQGAHYLWTYGPTFVLTVIAIFWARMEFQIKQATPWTELQRGETVTKDSLMLNYTTAPIYEILVKSLRRSHYSVALVVSGTIILQLATIASTGLLRLEYRDIDRQAEFIVLDHFDFLNNNGTTDMTVGPKLWAIEQYNSSYPAGTSPEEATQSFASIERGRVTGMPSCN
ncbi:hypothetical protein SLS55_006794 [Diplodia seriata]|uniref:DUF304 domain-containing protein n=1 Tax=Diplodia seriata TaxID=420778 RepID=A0ABR3CD05_9PEZI